MSRATQPGGRSRQTAGLLLCLGLFACRAEPGPEPQATPPCPPDHALIEVAEGGESLVLGAAHDDLVQGFGSDVLVADADKPIRLERSYCFANTALPGRGRPWLQGEGAAVDAAWVGPLLVPALHRFGRRLPTFEEYLLVAQGRERWEYPHRREGHIEAPPCEPDARTQAQRPIGAWPDCVTKHSSWRVHDLGTRATPVTMSAGQCRRVEASRFEGGYGRTAPSPQTLAACDVLGTGTRPSPVRVFFAGSFDPESLGLVEGLAGAFWGPSPAGRHFHDGPHASVHGAFVDDGGVFLVTEPGPRDPRVEQAWTACMDLLSEHSRWSVLWTECPALLEASPG